MIIDVVAGAGHGVGIVLVVVVVVVAPISPYIIPYNPVVVSILFSIIPSITP